MAAPPPEAVPPDRLFAAGLSGTGSGTRTVPSPAAAKPAVSVKPAASAPKAQPVPPPEPPPIDCSSVRAGSPLFHKAFGRGTVTRLEGGYVTVAFPDMEKKFLFPNAILQGFLTILPQ